MATGQAATDLIDDDDHHVGTRERTVEARALLQHILVCRPMDGHIETHCDDDQPLKAIKVGQRVERKGLNAASTTTRHAGTE